MWDGDLTGEVIGGRYALGDLYGSGGMADVYRAFDTRLDRRVAIKLFQGSATREDRVRLDREVQVLAALRCPGVVAVYDTGSFQGRPFFVMQPVEGGTLRRRMREPLPPGVVARIGAQVAEVLAHVHRHGVVHRDVKPSNILLEPDERRAYLADFGLALQAHVTRVTRSGMLVGTAGYLAPEQVRGAEVGPAADVYALGLVLLECLTGRPEYPGGDTEAALSRLHREPRVPEGLPAPWIAALTAMTRSLPTRRPDAAECAALLTEAERAGAAPSTEVVPASRVPAPVVRVDAPPVDAPPVDVGPAEVGSADVGSAEVGSIEVASAGAVPVDAAPARRGPAEVPRAGLARAGAPPAGVPASDPVPVRPSSRRKAVLVLSGVVAAVGVLAVVVAVNLPGAETRQQSGPPVTIDATAVPPPSASTVTVVRELPAPTEAPPSTSPTGSARAVPPEDRPAADDPSPQTTAEPPAGQGRGQGQHQDHDRPSPPTGKGKGKPEHRGGKDDGG
ncbi:serine/threonine-protein kinase [Saccharothrix australiensis]|uniref:non-specific serine/threonine protein kinase n=1 Tax=Saccharothrix australiensis TaxID=2072 RepID=A0A495W3M3_9PSEU|nr:serine/threonine-protein kinase [Saccharothrix australiensis]RKT56276.1 serine/threonine protein kinase [Saccharothrix australiensis]